MSNNRYKEGLEDGVELMGKMNSEILASLAWTTIAKIQKDKVSDICKITLKETKEIIDSLLGGKDG